MPTLVFRFPGGRYHATPSGNHVNEGLIEWPPSPWRLLRALIASGYATQGWLEVPPVARRVIEALAGTLPRYRLPPATVAHSRHFMPTGVLEKGREKTTLVFDSWANVGDGVLAVRWDCKLDEEGSSLFAVLASHLGYLGRSESWVLAEAVSDSAELPPGYDAFPHSEGRGVEPGWEQVSVIAAEPPGTYDTWRRQSVEKVLPTPPALVEKGRLSTKLQKDRTKAEAPYPVDVVDCLQKDTAWWKRLRWSQPPGSRRVLYWRSSDSLTVGIPLPAVTSAPARVTTMLLALSTASGNRSALPPCSRVLPQGELLHRSLIARAGGGDRINCPELTGKDGNGTPLVGHRHAHLLSVDLDGDGHLDHVIIYARMGLGAAAQKAVRSIRRTWTKGGVGDLQLGLAGQGDIEDLRHLPAPLDSGIAAVLGPPDGARDWVSLTPLVLPRHRKARGTSALEGQILAELSSRGMPPAAVEVLKWDDRTRTLRHALRVRRHPAKPPPADEGFAVRLIFDAPVRGPIALGYASHFGLGLFGAVE